MKSQPNVIELVTRPGYLQCSPEVAVKKPMEERPCCQKWDCPDLGALPDHLEGPVKVSGYNATSLKIEFGQLPKNLNGRSGFYQVHYVSGLSGHQVYCIFEFESTICIKKAL